MFNRVLGIPFLPFENTLGKVFGGDFDIEFDDIKLVSSLGILLEHVEEHHGAGKQTVANFFVVLEQDPLQQFSAFRKPLLFQDNPLLLVNPGFSCLIGRLFVPGDQM